MLFHLLLKNTTKSALCTVSLFLVDLQLQKTSFNVSLFWQKSTTENDHKKIYFVAADTSRFTVGERYGKIKLQAAAQAAFQAAPAVDHLVHSRNGRVDCGGGESCFIWQLVRLTDYLSYRTRLETVLYSYLFYLETLFFTPTPAENNAILLIAH